MLLDLQARTIETADLDFLRALYAQTRADEVRAAGWPDDTVRQFMARQFDLQHRYYHEHYSDADFCLLLRGERPVGRLYWLSDGPTATLIDITLLPHERGQGVGSALLALLTAQADACGQSVHLHVEPANPARRLYARFGFVVVGDKGLYLQMRRPAQADGSTGVGS